METSLSEAEAERTKRYKQRGKDLNEANKALRKLNTHVAFLESRVNSHSDPIIKDMIAEVEALISKQVAIIRELLSR